MAELENNQMKVLMMGSVYPRFQEDSEVPWMRETVKRLVDSGVEVELLVPSWKGLSTHEIDGVKIHRFRYAPAAWEFLTHDEGAPSKLARNPLFQLLAVPYMIMGALVLLRLQYTQKYDLLHVHWPFPHGLMAFPTQCIFKVPVLLNFHGASLLLQRKFSFVRPCLNFVLKKSPCILANSSFTRDKIIEIRDVDVTISPYGSTLEEKRNPSSVSPVSSIIGESPFKVLFVGRHIERKGIEYLIQAFQLLVNSRPDLVDHFQLDIVGGGESTQKLKHLAAETPDLPIQFPGKVSTEELSDYYEAADLFVLPAIVDSKGDTEGLGVVLVEAIQSDTAIIASRVGGIIDVVIHEETGLLVPEKDTHALCEAMLRIYKDKDLKAKVIHQARRRAHELFDWDVITQELVSKYELMRTN